MSRSIGLGLILFGCVAYAQLPTDVANTYATGMVVIGRQGENPSCPPIVWIARPDSPAARAGIKPGDRLLAIDGHHTSDLEQASRLLRTQDAKPATLELVGDKGPYTVTVSRVKLSDLLAKDGQKFAPGGSGDVFPVDATEAEMNRVESFDAARIRQRVFPTHYPENMDMYYPGFEVFVLQNPAQISVGGIEDGPARKAGVHWGDTILSVNGVNPLGKSVPELETLFSSPHPATMKLGIDRDGATKTYRFDLAKAADILRDNHLRLYKGRPIPSSIPPEYLHCFETE